MNDTETKPTMYGLLRTARESFKGRLDYDKDEADRAFTNDEPHDMISETADSCVPVYTYELMQLAAVEHPTSWLQFLCHRDITGAASYHMAVYCPDCWPIIINDNTEAARC